MIRLFEIKLPLEHRPEDLPAAIARILRIPLRQVESWEIRRQAIDARKKSSILLIYTVDVALSGEDRILRDVHSKHVIAAPDESYLPAKAGVEPLGTRPVVVGSGPAGLFAGLILAQAGYRPIVLERGKAVEERCVDVERFWREGILDPESNAQFGEGGAGTFSDGKLNTLINDPRCRKVLDELAAAGAPPTIRNSNKPHIGTDRLRQVVRTVRETIIALGGEVRFSQKVTGLKLSNSRLSGVQINYGETLACQCAIFALGHSARDSFEMLFGQGLTMIPKAFSIGVRIEHPQGLIDRAQYGAFAGHERLGAADYKLAYHADNGRSAYTFCMCPGGKVIAAASESDGIVTNGMSYLARNGQNANAALLVNVVPGDFPDSHPLAGFRFQRQWERLAFQLTDASFKAPVQRLADFRAAKPSAQLGSVTPTYRPGVALADLHRCLPGYVCDTIKQAIPAFAAPLRGFDLPDAVLTGVETRSSCPVRLVRGEDRQANIGGIYPAGEGAGYAGGITSAAADGIRVAEAVISRFAPPRP